MASELEVGKIGVGAAPSAYQLDVLTTGNNGIRTNNGTAQIYLGSTGGNASVGTLTDHTFNLIANGGSKVAISSTGQTTLTSSNQNVLLVNRTTSNGDAIVVEAAGADRVRIGTEGITFPNGGTAPASAPANRLDYYAEGTFTPTLAKGSTSVTSPNTAKGRYVRVGKQLFVSFYYYKTGAPTTTGSSNWTIQGLPFACVTGETYQSVKAGYVLIQNSSYQHTSPYRWQLSTTDGTSLLLFGTQATTNNTGGSVEFSAFGVLEVA